MTVLTQLVSDYHIEFNFIPSLNKNGENVTQNVSGKDSNTTPIMILRVLSLNGERNTPLENNYHHNEIVAEVFAHMFMNSLDSGLFSPRQSGAEYIQNQIAEGTENFEGFDDGIAGQPK